jgi:D-alanyl-D-alanine carboxypeptidase
MSESELLAALRAKLQQKVAADRFSGAILVAKNGTPIYSAAFGLAGREKKIPNELDTKFRIGSMNKMFTATSILQLAQARKLQLTDPLGKYLTDYPNKNVASKVTIHHLLTHTGGTGDFFGPQFDADRLELRALKDYVTLYGKRDLAFEPGSRWEYSNYGFMLARPDSRKGQRPGLLRLCSGSCLQACRNELDWFTAGRRNCGGPFHRLHQRWRNIASEHRRADSTVEDLLRFANALSGHQLLDEHYTDLLTTGKVEAGNGGKYAYRSGDHIEDGIRWFGHGGGAPGMNGYLKIFPQSGYVIAVLATAWGRRFRLPTYFFDERYLSAYSTLSPGNRAKSRSLVYIVCVHCWWTLLVDTVGVHCWCTRWRHAVWPAPPSERNTGWP